MRNVLLVAAHVVVFVMVSRSCSLADDSPTAESAALLGRWDLVMEGSDGTFPSWLEVRKSGNSTLVGSFVGQFGSSRPIGKISTADGKFHFSIPPQWEKRTDDQAFTFSLAGDDSLVGATTDERGRTISWSGQRAPRLHRSAMPKWGEPIEIFNGKNLDGWHTQLQGIPNGWAVRDGLLRNEEPGNNLVTNQRFHDFKLHAEFRYPQGSNSGIYLRGRYEIQIEDGYGEIAESHIIGGVYGFLTPSSNAAKQAGEWQTYDITLIGRTVTVLLNGERVIDRQVIPGITGGALDSDESTAGPIMLQGDHGPVEFRKLTLTPASETVSETK